MFTLLPSGRDSNWVPLVLLKWEVAVILGNGCGKGGRVMRWQGGKGKRVVRWECRRFLVLCKSGEYKVSPRFYHFVSDVNQGNKGVV